MQPYITILGRSFPTYGFLGVVGALLGWLYVYLRCKKEDPSKETDSVILYLYGVVGALIGAKLFYLVQNLPNIITDIQRSPEDTISILAANIQGGMVFYGGLIGALFFVLWYARRYQLILWDYLVILVPALPLAHGFGRIGCFFAGCCYGHVGPLPVQLVEAFANFVLCIMLTMLSRKRKDGKVLLAAYLISYGVIRFFLEFFREDTARGFLWMFSTSQVISIFVIIFGAFLILKGSPSKSD